MNNKRNYKIILLVCLFAFIFEEINFRVCIFYKLFKIPCVVCGLNRSIKALLKLHIMESIEYNILGIPMALGILMYMILGFFKKPSTVEIFLKEYRTIVIFISIILMIVTWNINIHNPVLYS